VARDFGNRCRRFGFRRVNGACGLVAKCSGSYNLGEYFGTAVRKRKVHWPKGQVVANLFRAGPVVV